MATSLRQPDAEQPGRGPTGTSRHGWLVADIGGTNARFALADPTTRELAAELTLPTSDAKTLADLTGVYLALTGAGPIEAACFAIAGPVGGDRCSLTNADLEFSIEDTRAELGFSTLLVVNDFAAVARSIPELGPQHLFQVGDVRPDLARGAVAVGPGTGLGVATIVPSDTGWSVLPGEGGHVALAGLHEDELEVVRELRNRWGYASAEMVLSGPGLVRLYGALAGARTESGDVRPEVIVERALSGADHTSVATLGMFCELLATVAANAALTTGATGGVFLAGGIVKRFPEFLARSGFRERFTWHPHAGSYLAQISTVIVTAPEPGLVGALHVLADHEGGPARGRAVGSCDSADSPTARPMPYRGRR